MKKIFLLILLSNFLNASAQKVYIYGKLPDKKDTIEVWVSRSITEDPVNWCYKYQKADVTDGVFKAFFSSPVNSTIRMDIIFNRKEYKFNLICKNNDSIEIKIRNDEIYFEGSNAEGHKLAYKNKMFKHQTWVKSLGNILSEATGINSAIQQIEKLKFSYFKRFDSLYKTKAISNLYCKSAKNEIQANLLSTLYMMILSSPDPSLKFKLSDSDLLKMVTYFYKKYDPFNLRFHSIDGVTLDLIIHGKCILIERGILNSKRNVTGLWKGTEKCFEFAPVKLQPAIFAKGIMINLYHNFYNDSTNLANSNLLKKHFPTSPYIPKIEELIKEKERQQKHFKDYSLDYFDVTTRELKVVNVKQHNSIEDLIKDKFPGRYVFVDIWATWCGPCKMEFQYTDSLFSFCNKNKIVQLYLSIDGSSTRTNCAKVIKSYDLGGYHYLATDSINGSLNKLLKIDQLFIPRYLLFDKQGNLVDGDLPRPSQMPELIKRIKQLLIL